EVDLGLAGRVGQRDEDLGVLVAPGSNGVLDGRQAALVAVLVAEPLEDPHGGVALLPGGLLVVLEDLVEDREEGPELGLGPRPLLAIAGRLGVIEDLAEGLPVEVELPLDGAHALAVDEDATADLGPVVHVREHRVTSRRRAGCGADSPDPGPTTRA